MASHQRFRGRASWNMKRAFTLIELLVVIAVTGLLASLLLPVLGQAKRRAKRVLCLNNLRQFALADTMYLNEYGQFPQMNDFVPSSITLERLTIMAKYLGETLPPALLTLGLNALSNPSGSTVPWPLIRALRRALRLAADFTMGTSMSVASNNPQWSRADLRRL